VKTPELQLTKLDGATYVASMPILQNWMPWMEVVERFSRSGVIN
jgi:hypothetical protein